MEDVSFSRGRLVKATFIGAASSAVTFGIGSAAGNLFANFYSQAAFSAAAHGTFQGSMTAISGGKFWSGFAAGALSSIAASAWSGGNSVDTKFQANSSLTEGHFVTNTFSHQGISGALGANNTIGMIAFGTVSGGAGAQLTGGNFWQGAVTGLVVSGLNHAMHNMSGDNDIDPPGKKGKLQSNLNEHTTAIGNTVGSFGSYAMALEDVSHANAGLVYKYGSGSLSAHQLTRLNKLSQLRVAKFASVGGKALGVAGGAISYYQWTQNQISGYELSADLIMTGVGFLGPVGAGASLVYFGGKAIYNYYNPNNPLFVIPKN